MQSKGGSEHIEKQWTRSIFSSYPVMLCGPTLYYCCQSRFDYFLRHLRPEHTRPGCTIIRVALTKAVETLGYDSMIIGENITTRRLHLPIRQGGCGIRNLYKLAVAAYSSSFIEAAITFTTSEIVMHGTFKGLANAFPAAGFQPGGSRFQRALGLGNLPSMQSCADAWDEMRLEVNQPAVGPLPGTALSDNLECRTWYGLALPSETAHSATH